MADYVSVANLALSKIGAEDQITSPDQDSHAARSVAAVWDNIRQGVIRGGKHAPRWNFAMTYRELAARPATVDNPVPYGWAGAYPRPDGALRLCEILSPTLASEGRWMLAGNEVLLMDEGPLKAWWLFDIENPAAWDALFVEAFAARLAFQVCDRVSGDRGRKSDCWAEYEANLAAASKVDAGENPPVEQEESNWITARYQGATGDWSRLPR